MYGGKTTQSQWHIVCWMYKVIGEMNTAWHRLNLISYRAIVHTMQQMSDTALNSRLLIHPSSVVTKLWQTLSDTVVEYAVPMGIFIMWILSYSNVISTRVNFFLNYGDRVVRSKWTVNNINVFIIQKIGCSAKAVRSEMIYIFFYS
jgi:hypothetical protein